MLGRANVPEHINVNTTCGHGATLEHSKRHVVFIPVWYEIEVFCSNKCTKKIKLHRTINVICPNRRIDCQQYPNFNTKKHTDPTHVF